MQDYAEMLKADREDDQEEGSDSEDQAQELASEMAKRKASEVAANAANKMRVAAIATKRMLVAFFTSVILPALPVLIGGVVVIALIAFVLLVLSYLDFKAGTPIYDSAIAEEMKSRGEKVQSQLMTEMTGTQFPQK